MNSLRPVNEINNNRSRDAAGNFTYVCQGPGVIAGSLPPPVKLNKVNVTGMQDFGSDATSVVPLPYEDQARSSDICAPRFAAHEDPIQPCSFSGPGGASILYDEGPPQLPPVPGIEALAPSTYSPTGPFDALEVEHAIHQPTPNNRFGDVHNSPANPLSWPNNGDTSLRPTTASDLHDNPAGGLGHQASQLGDEDAYVHPTSLQDGSSVTGPVNGIVDVSSSFTGTQNTPGGQIRPALSQKQAKRAAMARKELFEDDYN
ncbi:hypothetical protein BC835DRAFT_1414470 [Cytidiella melzeri]|nr:hypothetical protein BC835DRAFT_1414470 [Cytidiella melzeri]